MRQSIEPGRGTTISSLAYDYKAEGRAPLHAHLSDQLVYATRGVMEVTVGQNFWVIPPQFALWIPAEIPHEIRMPASVLMRTLYLRARTARKMPSHCVVRHVTPLLREVILEIVRIGRLRARLPLHAALKEVLVANLEAAESVPTHLVFPRDARGLHVAKATLGSIASNPIMSELNRGSGASERTIQRIFLREVGSNFEVWRQQARLLQAVELLVGGFSVKETSSRVGYQNSRTLVGLFRTAFGATPMEWLRGLRKSRHEDR